MPETYQEKIIRLAALRVSLNQIWDKNSELLGKVTNSPEYIDLSDRAEKIADEIAHLENDIRCEAIASAKVDGILKRAGVTVTNHYPKKVVYDQNRALEWIKKESPEFLAPDWAAFEKYALAVAGGPKAVPFVKIEEETITKASISRDLSAFIQPIPKEKPDADPD